MRHFIICGHFVVFCFNFKICVVYNNCTNDVIFGVGIVDVTVESSSARSNIDNVERNLLDANESTIASSSLVKNEGIFL